MIAAITMAVTDVGSARRVRQNPMARASSSQGDAMPGKDKPQPGLLQYNGDWAVGCDNLLRCEAIALRPEMAAADAGEPMLLQISRNGGPAGETVLRVSGLAQLPPEILLLLDGREEAKLSVTGDEAVIRGVQALSTVQALGGAMTIEVRAVGRKARALPPIASFSSTGLAESLRFIDSRQARTGTRSAFVSRGEGADAVVPAPPIVPVVMQVPSPDADSAPALTPPEMAVARKLAVCDAMLMAEGAVELFPLDGHSALLLLPCAGGDYNVSAVPLIARGEAGSRTLSIARFDFAPGFTGEPGKPPLVVNALWDAKRGVLSSLAKGRGGGDCGASEDYVWDGMQFRLIESRAMHVCRGAWEWIRLWEASPERAAVAPVTESRAAVKPAG